MVAAAAAQTFGKLFSSGAQKLGSFLSSATSAAVPKPPQPPTTISSMPMQAPTPSYTPRSSLQQQVSVTQADEHIYGNNMMMEPQVPVSYPSDTVLEHDEYYNGSELVKQESLDYGRTLEDREYTLRKQDSIVDRGYLQQQESIADRGYLHQQQSIDSYGIEDGEYPQDDYGKNESPVSVIHVDRLEPISGLLDGEDDINALENSLVEPYRPKPLSPVQSRKESLDVHLNGDIGIAGHGPIITDLVKEQNIISPPKDRIQDHTGKHLIY